MKKREMCVWYNESAGVKRSYNLGLIGGKWLENYCWKGGEGCVRKKRFEEEGYISPDYVLPDGTVSERVEGYLERNTNITVMVNDF